MNKSESHPLKNHFSGKAFSNHNKKQNTKISAKYKRLNEIFQVFDLMDDKGKVSNQSVIQNGLASALGYNDLGPGFGNSYCSSELSQTDTLFKNNRWYLVSNMRQLLSEIYVEHGLIKNIIGVPVDDGLRGGVKISSSQLDEDEIKKLQNYLKRNNILKIIGDAIRWERLFGGSGVLIVTNQNPITPLNLNLIKSNSPLDFRAVDLWELTWNSQNTEGYDPEIQDYDFEYYQYYSQLVDKSRVMRLEGQTAPSFIRPRLRGWGFSAIEQCVRSINQFLKANDLAFEVLDEFKVDIFKIKNLTDTLASPDGEAQVSKRIRLAQWEKNYQNSLIMDSEDDFDHKQLSFAGLAEVMQEIRRSLSCEVRMTQIKLWGQGPSGLNASGEDEIEVYNSMVKGEVRDKAEFTILRTLEVICQKLFEFVPDDLEIEFEPLRVLSSVDEENVKTQKFSRIAQARQMGEISSFEFREACNKANLLEIQLDNKGDILNPNDPEIEGMLNNPIASALPEPDVAAEDGRPNPRDATAKDDVNSKDNNNRKAITNSKNKFWSFRRSSAA